jgi:hypothetical protein
MNQSERRKTIEKQYLSTRIAITIAELALMFDVAENFIKADLFILEVFAAPYCPNPNSKPQKWYATQLTKPEEMSLKLFFALKNVKAAVIPMLPAELYEAVSPVFEAANETYTQALKLVHQHSNSDMDAGSFEVVISDYTPFSGAVRIRDFIDFYYDNAANDSDFYSDEAA